MNIEEKLKSNASQIQRICDYLKKECDHDKHLEERILIQEKTIEKMYEYIMKKVKIQFKNQIVNNGVMVSDEEVYSMATHYFIEEDADLEKEFPKTEPVKTPEQKKAEEPADNGKLIDIKKDKDGTYNYVYESKKPKTVLKPYKPKKEIGEQLSLFETGD